MSELYFAGMDCPVEITHIEVVVHDGPYRPVVAMRGNSPTQPKDHKVRHRWIADQAGREVCLWCAGTRAYHDSGNPTPYRMDAPSYKVDAWKADDARRAELEEATQPKDESYRWRKFWE